MRARRRGRRCWRRLTLGPRLGPASRSRAESARAETAGAWSDWLSRSLPRWLGLCQVGTCWPWDAAAQTTLVPSPPSWPPTPARTTAPNHYSTICPIPSPFLALRPAIVSASVLLRFRKQRATCLARPLSQAINFPLARRCITFFARGRTSHGGVHSSRRTYLASSVQFPVPPPDHGHSGDSQHELRHAPR